MKSVVILALAVLASASGTSDAFRKWAVAHGKVYTATEFPRREAIFAQNLARIEAMNAEGHAFFAPTVFADLTQEEFQARLRSLPPAEETVERTHYVARTGVKDLPAAFDWRDKTGVVGKVKDQASCGSCWAFSTVGYLEGQLVVKQAEAPLILSEQQIVDCDDNCLTTPAPDGHPCDIGCGGGWPTTALQYILSNGSMPESAYKYRGYDQDCRYDASKVAAHFTGTPASLEIGDEASIKDLLYTHGPLSVSLDASPWSFYTAGIYESSSCSTEWKAIDHSVVVVGWGHDEKSGKDFWIVRNSWGPSWGEKGYIRILMGKNICGIANMVVYLKY